MGDDQQNFRDYLAAQLDRRGWTPADLKRNSTIGQSLISRWLRGETTPSVDNARALSEAIKRPLLEVLVAAGQLRPDEVAARVAAPVQVADLSNSELLSEIERRLNAASRRIATTHGGASRSGDWVEGPRRGDQGKPRRRRAQSR